MFFTRAQPELRRIAEYVRRGEVPPMPGDAAGPSAGPPRAGAPGQGGADRKVGRNDPCPCGSGKKYKRCCGRAGG
jgi:hypothetical protein